MTRRICENEESGVGAPQVGAGALPLSEMKLSEFWALMEHEFGAGYAPVLARDLVLGSLDHRTAVEALDAGVNPKTVWFAICEEQEIPQERRWGPDKEPLR